MLLEIKMRTKSSLLVLGLASVLVSPAVAATKYAKSGGLTTGNCDTWNNACTLDRAISLAVSGDSVWAKKTSGYSPYGPIALKNGVKIIGGFMGTETQASQSDPFTGVTAIDGGGTQQCVTSNANGSSTVLRGFTLKNCQIGDDWDGGAGLVLSSSDALIVNCIFENNTAMRFGAAVAIHGTGSPKFFNCVFRNNGSGTAGSAQDSNVQPMAGGAVYLKGGSPSFVNCLFYGNKAAEGAAVANAGGTPTFTNCTIANNNAKSGYGGGLNDEWAKSTMRNCILWGNTATKGGNQIFNAPSVITSATHCDIQGGWTGTGNINADPVFTNPAGGDFTLQAGTPCVNVGSGTMPDDVGDLDWDTITSEPVPRDLNDGARVNVIIDMGAYEIQASGGGAEE